jgi:hypothetical protein
MYLYVKRGDWIVAALDIFAANFVPGLEMTNHYPLFYKTVTVHSYKALKV